MMAAPGLPARPLGPEAPGHDCSFLVGPHEGDSEEVRAHSWVLRRASPVFAALLPPEGAPAAAVRVRDVTTQTFLLLLRHAYTGQVAPWSSVAQAVELALAAHTFQLLALREASVEHVEQHVAPTCVWRALELARTLDHAALTATCVQVLRAHTTACVSEASGFLEAGEVGVALLMEQGGVVPDSQLQLMEAAVSWARHQAHARGLEAEDAGALEAAMLAKLQFLALDTGDVVDGPFSFL